MAAIQTLKAAADPTRLRLLALLANGEATVGELQEILQQSQPRVSRHLRLLDEAGLVVKFRDDHWIYYRLAGTATAVAIVTELLDLIASDDEIVESDRAALDRVKNNREREVFRLQALTAVGAAGRPSVESFSEAFDECIGDQRFADVLDVGCGGGMLLRLLGQRARRAVGIDISRRMRLLARSRLHRAGLANCTVRKGDLMKLPFADDSFDLVVLDEVLGEFEDILTGLNEAQRVLRPAGQLLVADRLRPVARQLPGQRGGIRLIENQLTAMLSELGYRIAHRIWFPGKVMEYALFAAIPDNLQQRTGTYG
ncbi:MAG: metalloregulator ArsR/SmtB family transcription factor [Gammaproteobacteria bacterium]|nr:metalloregulator ArsR/SmtB family transcription factor [Gammaproteobacteria bacterium]MDP7297471.1 metalloregulator ArsR/SmtB family transcription factor [Gammaproteobacteria bacterium]MDP7419787.1 metalloregulator ArsR/SmtB family transcription factor [Gammaproteobacteria bacterium]MDP7660150.1 metalloregulator ArsR/SmtB family transcription factor [Gammaproteobacteria bacterium]HJP37775.1 metalloregulator ArsR/SmtB family transcription factor [Gammaproteobacteria bacterium]